LLETANRFFGNADEKLTAEEHAAVGGHSSF
jgi:hypothetical protein